MKSGPRSTPAVDREVRLVEKKCLQGLRVLELSHFISAPYAGQMLADLGADVIKIELPGEGKGDIARKYDPMYKDMSLYFASYNRNKRFLTLNLKNPEGQEIFKELVRKSDVVLNNFRPGVMEKMNLGYEQLKAVDPGIIMASLSGFGQTGPNVRRQALDMTIQALSGFMDLTGFPDAPPTKGGPAISDFFAGLYLTIGVLAAYVCRQRTGEGQNVDIALFDAMFVLMENYPAIYRMNGELPKRAGNGRPFSAPVGTYRAKDGAWVQISGTAEAHFEKLMELIGHPEHIGRSGMVGAAVRKKESEGLLNTEIQAWLDTVTGEEAVAAMDRYGIPNALVRTAEQVFNDPQVAAREMLVRPEENVLDDLPVIGNPIKMSLTPAQYRRSACAPGKDSGEILRELLGRTPEAVEELRKQHII